MPVVGAQSHAAASVSLAEAHRRMLADASLQFGFVPAAEPSAPSWLKPLLELLKPVFGFLTAMAPWLMWGFWALVAAGLVAIIVMIVREILRVRWPARFGGRDQLEPEPEDYRPSQAQARALLEDADALAAEGRFAEAAHLLLFRSIEDIEGRRPYLVRPALTSRDIARSSGLPEAARTAFSGIARVVERSHFGGAPVGADDFAACRRAYETFAFPEVWA